MTSPDPISSDVARLRAELNERTVLVQQVREELIRSQIMVLELQDTILQKETDKADAVSLLGQAELVLEGKINYIFELDRVLNEQLAGVRRELANCEAARQQLAQEFATAQSRLTADAKAHEAVVSDLVSKIDLVNRDLGTAHELAGKYAREAAELRAQLASTNAEAAAQRAEAGAALSAERASAARLKEELTAMTGARDTARNEVAEIRTSFAWKLTAPLRAVFGPKS